MKTIYIFDHFLLPTPYNHRFFVEKFAKGFIHHGYEMRVIRRIGDITNPGFVMISNHSFYQSFGKRCQKRSLLRILFSRIEKMKIGQPFSYLCLQLKYTILKKLAHHLKGTNVTMIAWFWHDQASFIDSLEIPTIYTGELFYGEPSSALHKRWYTFYKKEPNALPISFAADINPILVGADIDNKTFKVSFIGNRTYKPDWYGPYQEKPDCRIVPTPPYIDESKRIDIYKKSFTTLGLHSEDNIHNHVVVERVFESLAFGAICITDNPSVLVATENIAVLATNKDEVKKLIDEYTTDKHLFIERQQKGLQFIRDKGTYAYQARLFIDLAQKLSSHENTP